MTYGLIARCIIEVLRAYDKDNPENYKSDSTALHNSAKFHEGRISV